MVTVISADITTISLLKQSGTLVLVLLKVVIHVEMPKAAPKKSICHFQKLEMLLK